MSGSEEASVLQDLEIKPCPKYKKGFFECGCHIEVIRTCAPFPKNIRVQCVRHSYLLPGCFETVEDAVEAWNKNAEECKKTK